MSYTIEKGIPIPSKSAVSQEVAATLKVMDVGDSIVITSWKTMSSVYTCAKTAGVKVMGRTLPNDEGIRVWRIE